MAEPKYGVQIRTDDRCKICSNDHRAWIEDYFMLGKKGHVAENGVVPTRGWIMENAPATWGITINSSNLSNHFKKHFEAGEPRAIAPQAVLDAATNLRKLVDDGGLEFVQPEQYLQLVVAIGYEKLLNNPEKVTTSDVLKAIDALTRRHHDETQAKLMQALGQGIASALGGVGPRPAIQSEAPIEVEAQEVSDAPPDASGRSSDDQADAA